LRAAPRWGGERGKYTHRASAVGVSHCNYGVLVVRLLKVDL